jgi:checkpoint serine/threonine-protein kinase
MSARRALASKDIGTAPLTLKTKCPGDGDKPNVFSKVFTPVEKEDIRQPAEYSLQPETQSLRTTGKNATLKPGTQRRTLLGDAQTPFKVFSRPPEANSVFSRPGSFAPSDEDTSNAAPPPDSSNPASLGTFIPQRQVEVLEVLSSEDEEYPEQEEMPPNAAVDYEEEPEEFEAAHEAPFGGRFGQFNVMTPITERTLEYTSTGRFSVPDGDTSIAVELGEKTFGEPDAVEAAERLAAEVREDNVFSGKPRAAQFRHNRRGDEESSSSSFEESLFSRPPPFRLSEGHTIITPDDANDDLELQAVTALVEERTGTLNLSDGVFTASQFDLPNPCNPFDPPIISTLLSHLPTDPHCYHVPRESRLLDGLQKFARKQMRTSRSSIRDESFSLRLEDAHFQVYEKLGEGGFGAVFAAKAVEAKAGGSNDEDDDEDDDEEDESRRVAIKVVKPGNTWEFQMLRKIHAGLPAPLRSSVIQPHALYISHDESFLILDLCTQGSLLDIINRASSAGVSQQGACLDELLVMFFTVELLRLLEGLHKAGFIHGDLKIDNCLMRLEDVSPSSAWAAQYDPTGAGGWHSKGIKLIDFGRTIDTRMFPRNQTFVAEWATDARDCVEMREGRPWTYQADYFGLAGIVYCMLYGKYIEASSIVLVTPPLQQRQVNRPRYKLAAAFKRYWQADLWTRLFDVLLNPCLVNPDGALPVSDTLAQLRAEIEAWLQANCNRSSNTLKGLLKKIELSVIRGD